MGLCKLSHIGGFLSTDTARDDGLKHFDTKFEIPSAMRMFSLYR